LIHFWLFNRYFNRVDVPKPVAPIEFIPLSLFDSIGPAISKCTNGVTYSLFKNDIKNAPAFYAPMTLPFPILHKSLWSPFIRSKCSAVTGSLQKFSDTVSPIWSISLAISSLLLKIPAVLSPRAAQHAPVNVEISIIFYGFFYCYVQLIQSASTNLPSASVLLISTVRPLWLLIISDGL